jgi:hypothetical protein
MAASLAAALSCTPARAEGPGPNDSLLEARRLFFEGVRAQDAGRYAEALGFYREARRRAVSPALLFDIATCDERLDHLVEAAEEYEQARALAVLQGDDDVEREARARVAAVRVALPHVVVEVPQGLQVTSAALDETSVDPATLARFPADPGPHRLVIRCANRTEDLAVSFSLAVGSEHVVALPVDAPRTALDVPRGALDAPPLDRYPPSRSPRYLPAWVAGGGAAVLGAAGLGTGIAAQIVRDRYVSLNANPTPQNRSERESLHGTAEGLYVANGVLLGAAGLAAGVALALAIWPPRASSPRAPAQGGASVVRAARAGVLEIDF